MVKIPWRGIAPRLFFTARQTMVSTRNVRDAHIYSVSKLEQNQAEHGVRRTGLGRATSRTQESRAMWRGFLRTGLESRLIGRVHHARGIEAGAPCSL